MDFDWNLIKSFLYVLDEGSFSGAAKKSSISQPTLSRHIEELEKSLKMTLFERGRNGAKPTKEALKLAYYARHVKIKTDALSLFALGKTNILGGTVRISSPRIISTHLLPKIIGDLLEKTPKIEIELVSTDRVENLLEREADIAIRTVRPNQQNLLAKKISDIEMGIFAHRQYLQKYGTPKNNADLLEHQILGYDREENIIRGFREEKINIDRHFFRFRCDDKIVYWHAICAGMGIGFAPKFLAHGHNDIVHLLPNITIPNLPLWLVTHKELRTNANIRMVYEFLSKELAKLLTRNND